MTLEVREHNEPAKALYAELGFVKAGERKRYYTDTGENAYIMWNNAIARSVHIRHERNFFNSQRIENDVYMNIVGRLMDKGIDYSKIIDDTFYTKTYNQNRIMGLALVKSKLYLVGQVYAVAEGLAHLGLAIRSRQSEAGCPRTP